MNGYFAASYAMRRNVRRRLRIFGKSSPLSMLFPIDSLYVGQYHSYRMPIGDGLKSEPTTLLQGDFGPIDLEIVSRWRDAWIRNFAPNPADHGRHFCCQARIAFSRFTQNGGRGLALLLLGRIRK